MDLYTVGMIETLAWVNARLSEGMAPEDLQARIQEVSRTVGLDLARKFEIIHLPDVV